IAGKKIPVAVGFGISNSVQAKKFATIGADAIIVGSAILRLIEKLKEKEIQPKIEQFTRDLKRSI
ncbi:MAG: tryptophan synthase subunit alpha, partial [Nitrosopumilaceae archaeon]